MLKFKTQILIGQVNHLSTSLTSIVQECASVWEGLLCPVLRKKWLLLYHCLILFFHCLHCVNNMCP